MSAFGNYEWVPQIKAMVTEPNSGIGTGNIAVAGLLARAGDYSQFEMLTTYIKNKEPMIAEAIRALGNFDTNSAASFLKDIAISGPAPSFRIEAIESLDKIAEKRPELLPKLVDALEANKDSNYPPLKKRCAEKLEKYGTKK